MKKLWDHEAIAKHYKEMFGEDMFKENEPTDEDFENEDFKAWWESLKERDK